MLVVEDHETNPLRKKSLLRASEHVAYHVPKPELYRQLALADLPTATRS